MKNIFVTKFHCFTMQISQKTENVQEQLKLVSALYAKNNKICVFI